MRGKKSYFTQKNYPPRFKQRTSEVGTKPTSYKGSDDIDQGHESHQSFAHVRIMFYINIV